MLKMILSIRIKSENSKQECKRINKKNIFIKLWLKAEKSWLKHTYKTIVI